MSKEVKRYELRIVDRYAGDGTGDIETDARMKQEAKGRYVLFSDYEALLAERDRLSLALLHADKTIFRLQAEQPTTRRIDAYLTKARHRIHDALQGEQP